jgi:hypothetical protein
MKSRTTLADRMQLLEERCGSQRAVGRLLGVTDMTIANWKGGGTALDSKLMEAARKSGISFEWLRDGTGNLEVELGKARPVSVAEEQNDRLVEKVPSLRESVEFIAKHGDPDDVAMVEQMLGAALQRIRARNARRGNATARLDGGRRS